ncbi:MAG: hypothetical protein WB424_02045 [Terracidiphilus sp.]
MDAKKADAVRQQTHEDFVFGRARLYRVSETKKVTAEIVQDRERLFALFKEQGLEKQADYTKCLARLLLNHNKLASYKGFRDGYRLKEEQLDEMSDPASYRILTYLWKHPGAKNEDIAKYLDRETLRLSSLSANHAPLFAPLPANITKILRANHVSMYKGQHWQDALNNQLTKGGLTEYLSRRRTASRDAHLKNMLINWPRLFMLHKQQRKASGKVTK